MTSQTSQPAPGNDLYFTRKTKRYARIGDTLRVMTEGAEITITLGDVTHVSVIVTEPTVVVRKSVRKRAQTTENTEPQATEPADNGAITDADIAVKATRKPRVRKPAAAK